MDATNGTLQASQHFPDSIRELANDAKAPAPALPPLLGQRGNRPLSPAEKEQCHRYEAELKRAAEEALARRIKENQECQAQPTKSPEQRKAEIQTAVDAFAKLVGPRYSPQRARVQTFCPYDEAPARQRQEAVIRRLTAIGKRLRTFLRAGRNLLFVGTVGTGKDHLMIALLYAACRLGFTVDHVKGRQLIWAFNEAHKYGERKRKLVAHYASRQVLGISDLIPAVEGPAHWELADLGEVIDARYSLNRPTFVTINLPREETAERDAANVLTEPVWDRLQEGEEPLYCFWESYRTRKGREDLYDTESPT